MCTGIRLEAADGTCVHGRTVEFGVPLDMEVAIVPRGHRFVGSTPVGPGKEWTARYAAAGASLFGEDALADGLNEVGLAAAGFYFPTFASYPETTDEDQARSLSVTELITWVLTSFATVGEVRAAIEAGEVALARQPVPGFGPEAPPFHFVVYDRSGGCLVVEPVDEQLVLHDDPIGVITNSPTFDWHLTNLRNYLALDPRGSSDVEVDGLDLAALGQGSGLLGVPGDYSPPSRFVRAALFCASARPAADAESAVAQAFHVLNAFDIPVGSVRASDDAAEHDDSTQLTAVRDPQALRLYWRTYADQTIRFVDLNDADLDASTIVRVGTKAKQPYLDVTGELVA